MFYLFTDQKRYYLVESHLTKSFEVKREKQIPDKYTLLDTGPNFKHLIEDYKLENVFLYFSKEGSPIYWSKGKEFL